MKFLLLLVSFILVTFLVKAYYFLLSKKLCNLFFNKQKRLFTFNFLFFNQFSFSPLEQFEIFKLIERGGYHDIFISNFTIFLFFNLFFIIFFMAHLVFYNHFIFKPFSFFFKKAYTFILALVYENIGKKEVRFFSYLFVLFVFFITSNLLGLVPYSFTVTSHISFTLIFSLFTFFSATYLGIFKHGVVFFSLFLPPNTPFLIVPFLIIIELVSYIARLFSLAIRLFANMMSGHTLLHILAKFGSLVLFSGGAYFFLSFLPLLIIFVVVFLESSIACLQAYVFGILFCIYINDGINLH